MTDSVIVEIDSTAGLFTISDIDKIEPTRDFFVFLKVPGTRFMTMLLPDGDKVCKNSVSRPSDESENLRDAHNTKLLLRQHCHEARTWNLFLQPGQAAFQSWAGDS